MDKEMVTQEDAIKRRIAAARMVLGMATLQTRFADRDGEWSLSDLLNNIEARLSPAPEGVDAREYERGIEDAARLIEVHPMWVDGKSVGTDMRPASRVDLAKAIRTLSPTPVPGDERMREALKEAETALKHAANTFYRYAKLHRDKATDDGDAKACANASMGEEMNAAIEFVRAALTPPPKGQNDG